MEKTILKVTLILMFIFISPLIYSYQLETYMVPMRDGIRLATDVYLPDDHSEALPVVLARTPYGKTNLSYIGTILTEFNYIFVAQDSRGRFDSEGVDTVFFDDGWGINQDGYDTVEWIAEQPWCNGKIGYIGASALGIMGNLMAGARPPHLVCQWIIVAATNLYEQAFFQGGEFRKSLVEEWLKAQNSFYKYYEFREHPLYDSLWEYGNLANRYHLINTPAVHVGGWFDIFLKGTIDGFVGRQHYGDEGALNNQMLIIGPWTHDINNRRQGELTFPENAVLPYLNDLMPLMWFDYWLKGYPTDISEMGPVLYYVMGDVDDPDAPGNYWRSAPDWPIPAGKIPFYFHQDGTLSREPPSETNSSTTFTFDPNNPVPTKGGANLSIPAGPYDQSDLELRDDVIVFTTPPLEKPIEVTGEILVVLYGSSSAPDTDWTAKLCDVYPDGRSMLITDGILKARHRISFSQEDFLKPGKIYLFKIDLWSTSIIFNRNHRIRVDISSSNYPRFEVNPNTGEPFAKHTSIQTAENTIYHEKSHPSFILLPLPEEEQPNITVTILPNKTIFHSFDNFKVDYEVYNPTLIENAKLLVLIHFEDSYFYYPDENLIELSINPGSRINNNLFDIELPEIHSDIEFSIIMAVCNKDSIDILSNVATVDLMLKP